jgi:hypothetical protein
MACTYTVTWKMLDSTKGLTQVWVPNKIYDRVAANFAKKARSAYAKKLLRQRMAPLSITPVCGGTCEGGWCKEIPLSGAPLPKNGLSDVYVCECTYFV